MSSAHGDGTVTVSAVAHTARATHPISRSCSWRTRAVRALGKLGEEGVAAGRVTVQSLGRDRPVAGFALAEQSGVEARQSVVDLVQLDLGLVVETLERLAIAEFTGPLLGVGRYERLFAKDSLSGPPPNIVGSLFCAPRSSMGGHRGVERRASSAT